MYGTTPKFTVKQNFSSDLFKCAINIKLEANKGLISNVANNGQPEAHGSGENIEDGNIMDNPNIPNVIMQHKNIDIDKILT